RQETPVATSSAPPDFKCQKLALSVLPSFIFLSTAAAKMEAFLGTWKVDSNEDFDKFLSYFGVSSTLAKLVARLGSKTKFSRKDDAYAIKISSVKGKTESIFRLGQEFEDNCSGGMPLKAIITIEDGVMKHVQTGANETITTTRRLEGNLMHVV
uniref:Lipocln_cytosolic_FA-bd_dom domain-containing protein n=1 Tax=Mesocestoides corti TaxID=53468 RepID=A0A5K3EY20_MESCO